MAQILIFRLRHAAGLLLLCLIAAATAVAQHGPYRFDHWTTDNGLPQNTVRAIVQTRDGYLWMTTFDGLARFDGVRFTVFDKNNTPALSNNRLTALYEDKDGTLWIGADQGEVVAYRDGIFTSYTAAGKPSGFPIADFKRDFSDELFILGEKKAFYPRTGKLISAPPEYTDPKRKLYRGPSGTAWTIAETGVEQQKGGQTTNYPVKFSMANDIIGMGVYEDGRGNLWLADDVNVYRFRDGQMTRYTERDGMPSRTILMPQCDDNDGTVWFSIGVPLGRGNGVVRFQDGRFTVYGSDAGLPTASYYKMIKDREGSIWVATSSGLYRLRKELITSFSTANGLINNEVYPLLKGRNGDIWIGTKQGLNVIKDGQFRRHPLSIFRANIQSLWEDRVGRLWIGSYGSLYRHVNGQIEVLNDWIGGGALVWTILQDQTGTVWVGTNNGLYKFEDDKVVTHYTTKDGLPGNDVKVIHESVVENGQSVIWFGTFDGLARFQNGGFTSYTKTQGLTGNRVRSLYEDADGTLWVGTYDDGLSRFRDGRFFNYRTEQGLFNNGVFQILEDRRGYFWISCNRGIYRVSRRELNEMAEGRLARINSVAFGKQDGMLNAECNGGRQPAGLVAADGRLWFPTMGGVAVVDPEAAQVNQLPPPVMIESVTLDRRRVDFSQGVKVAPGQRDLEIDYTGLSLMKSEQVKFKYKLEGLDTEWMEAGTRRVAYFPYLSPGKYTFRVLAANSDGVWNQTGASVRITVVPPFWRTWWFLALLLALGAGAVLVWDRRRIARLEHSRAAQAAFSRQLIASQEGERQRLAAELHDSLSQNLVIIKNRAMISLQQPDDPENVLEQVAEIAEAADHALFEVREIAHNLRPFQIDRLGLTKAIEAMVRKVGRGGLQFSSRIDKIDSLLPAESEINLYRIIQESINNIIKHSQATEASVTVESREHEIEVTIQDNGCGFAPGAATLNPSPQGGGMGLPGITERARILGSAPVIESAPGQGTRIHLQIRLGRTYDN